MFNTLFRKFFIKTKKEAKQRDFEWENFQSSVRQQLKSLQNKGISIPVITL